MNYETVKYLYLQDLGHKSCLMCVTRELTSSISTRLIPPTSGKLLSHAGSTYNQTSQGNEYLHSLLKRLL